MTSIVLNKHPFSEHLINKCASHDQDNLKYSLWYSCEEGLSVSCPAKERDPRYMTRARQAGHCSPQCGVQSHLAWRWRAEWGWHSPGTARHTGNDIGGLRPRQPGKTGQAQGWAQHCLPGAKARTMDGVNVDPGSWSVGAQMESKSDASCGSFSQESCLHGSHLQGGISVPHQSRSWTHAAQAL